MAIIKHRRGTTTDWERCKDLILEYGELGLQFCEDKSVIIKVGDGETPYENLKDIKIPGYAKEVSIDLLNTRIDNIIALPEGSIPNDAELVDMRLGYDGITYGSAGQAVRNTISSVDEKIENLKENLNDLIDIDVIDGLLYKDDMLYLTANGDIVSEGVKIEGGGSGSSSLQVSIEMLDETNTLNISESQSAKLNFKFTSIEYGSTTGQCTCNIYRNSVHKSSRKIPNNEPIEIDITEHLSVGYNEILIECIDLYGNRRQLNYSINVIALEIASTFNDAEIIRGDSFNFSCTQTGNIDKVIHVVINPGDNEIHATKELKKGANKQQAIEGIPCLNHGVYPMDVYMTALIGEDTVESNHLYYDVMFVEENVNTPLISSCYKVKEITQGELISIPYTVYDLGKYSCDVTLRVSHMVNGEEQFEDTNRTVINGSKNYWDIRNVPTGNIKLSIIYESYEKSHVITIKENDLNIEGYSTGLELFLSSEGRSNNDINYDSWKFNNIETTFNNFNWRTNGWLEDSNKDVCLRLNGDASIEIDVKPFYDDAKRNGKTLEFEFAIRDVNDRTAVVIECFDDNVGLYATADKMVFQSTNDMVYCNYTENQRVRVGFTVSKLVQGSKDTFLCVYLNGVLSGIKHIDSTDSFAQYPAQTIKIGSSKCGIDLYSIRTYNVCLSDEDMVRNYIADIPNILDKMDIYKDNDVYLDEKISYAKVKSKIPTITFIGKMPTYKGDKRPIKDINGNIDPRTNVRMIFEHPTKPELNFDEILKQIDVQGTSSAGYVRKNWKTKHNEAHTHIEGELPAKVFCIKVDYAEATGTHNTQNANIIETLYDTPVPPKVIPEGIDLSGRNLDSVEEINKVRTTIAGFPVVIFHLDTDEPELINNLTIANLESGEYDLVFSSKGNFNYDKDAEDVFAFNDQYDVECWEFLKNEDPQSFLTPWPDKPLDYWEARYHDRLGDLEDAQDAENDEAIETISTEMFERFRDMYEWVHSTARGLYNGVPQASGGELDTPYVDSLGKIYTHDNDEYRLVKFKEEFENYFNLEYAAIYYVYTFFALMVDQRAKNLFLTYWRDNAYGPKDDTNPGRWYPYFYDNDTSYGISNKGHLDFDYYHQDTDSLNGSNVFNGANSVLWCNFRDAFPSLIQSTYSRLRRTGKISFNKIINQFVTEGSDNWSATLYNQDADYKYISVDSDVVDGETTSYPYLFQVRGSGEHHLEYFVENRIKFCDSKWKCEDYLNDRTHTAKVNIYNPTTSAEYQQCAEWEKTQEGERPAYYDTYLKIKNSISIRPAGTTISITPFSRMYYAVQYGKPSGDDGTKGMISKLSLDTSTPLVFEHTNTGQLNDFETTIFGARDISSLGDLSNLYAKEILISNCVKLTELNVGCDEVGANGEEYYNPNLTTLTTGSNTLLRSINVCNCPNLKGKLDLEGCINLEEVKATGSGIASLSLPDGGYVTSLHLPDTFNNLTLKGQKYLTNDGIVFANYNSLSQLVIDNCPNINILNLLERCKDNDDNYTLKFLRLTGVDLGEVSYDYLMNKLATIGGIDDTGNAYFPDPATNRAAYIQGTCRITEKITGAQLANIVRLFPYLTVTYDELELTVTYKSEDGSQDLLEHQTYTIKNGSTATGLTIIDPVKEELIDEPTKESTAQYDFTFGGWSRTPNSAPSKEALEDIISDTTLYVAFNKKIRSYPVRFYNGSILEKEILVEYGSTAYYGDIDPVKKDTSVPELYTFIGWEPSNENIVKPTNCYAQYHFYETDEDLHTFDLVEFDYEITSADEITLKKYNGVEIAGKINDYYSTDKEYPVTTIKGFIRSDIELIVLPDTLKTIGTECFMDCGKLVSIEIPKNVETIESDAFKSTSSLERIDVEDGNTKYRSENNCVIDSDNTLIVGCKNSVIPDEIVKIGSHSFWGCPIESIDIPNTVEEIAGYAFTSSSITNFDLPDGCKTFGAMAFYGTPIESLVFPSSTEHIGMYCTSYCDKLKELTIKQSDCRKIDIDDEAFNNCLNLTTINVPWGEGEVPHAPWGATNATINYNYVEV